MGRPDSLLVSVTLSENGFPFVAIAAETCHIAWISLMVRRFRWESSLEYLFLFLFLLTYMCMQYSKRKRFGNCFAFVFVFPFVLFSLCSLVFVSFTYILTPLWNILPGYLSLSCTCSIFLNYQSRKKPWYFSLNYQFEFYKLGWFFCLCLCAHLDISCLTFLLTLMCQKQIYSFAVFFNWSLTIFFPVFWIILYIN